MEREPRPDVAAIGLALGFALLLAAFGAAAQTDTAATDRVIVRFWDWADADRAAPMSDARARSLSAVARTRLDPVRRMSGGAHVMQLAQPMAMGDVEAVAARLAADPAVMHAEPDRRKLPLAVPTDPLYAQQWSLFEPAGGINAPRAWDVTTGSPAIVIAVIDTGVRPANRDLAGRLLPGYDFIREDAAGLFATANDGDGRDADASDPGNWISAAEAGQAPFAACRTPEDSSWHGTHNAGIAAASANNGYGIAGIAPGVRVLPVRALGKCGGYTSDIIDAIRWAAGLAVPATPGNPSAAHVLNLSLGSASACSVEEQRAIDDALATGRVKAIVASAGNTGGDSTRVAPGNCRGVIAVTGTDRLGRRAPYAAVGSNVALAAPGGNIAPNASSGMDGVLSLFNTGRTVPAQDTFAFTAGTSGAAAHVSGVAALVLSVDSALSATALRDLLLRTSRAFPDASCNTSICGRGIVDAGAAVLAAMPSAAAAIAPAPAPSAAPEPAPSAPVAAAAAPPPAPALAQSTASGSGGGGGSGGCTVAPDGRPDIALPLAALWALVMLRRRARAPLDAIRA